MAVVPFPAAPQPPYVLDRGHPMAGTLRLYAPLVNGQRADAASGTPDTGTGLRPVLGSSPWGRASQWGNSTQGNLWIGRGYTNLASQPPQGCTLFALVRQTQGTTGRNWITTSSAASTGFGMGHGGTSEILYYNRVGVGSDNFNLCPVPLSVWCAAAIVRTTNAAACPVVAHVYNYEAGTYSTQSVTGNAHNAGDGNVVTTAGTFNLGLVMPLCGIDDRPWSSADFLRWVADPFAPARRRSRTLQLALSRLPMGFADTVLLPSVVGLSQGANLAMSPSLGLSSAATLPPVGRLGIGQSLTLPATAALAPSCVRVLLTSLDLSATATLGTVPRLDARPVLSLPAATVFTLPVPSARLLGSVPLPATGRIVFTPPFVDILTAVVARLINSPALREIVGARIYPGLVPEASEWPHIAYLLVADEDIEDIDGMCGTARARIQLSFRGPKLAECRLAAEAVRLRLSNYLGPMYGVQVETTRKAGEVYLGAEPAGDGSDRGIHHLAVDYTLTYRKPIPHPTID